MDKTICTCSNKDPQQKYRFGSVSIRLPGDFNILSNNRNLTVVNLSPTILEI